MKTASYLVKKMLASAILPLALVLPAFFVPVSAQEAPSVSARCAAVIHMDTGEVLFEKKA